MVISWIIGCVFVFFGILFFSELTKSQSGRKANISLFFWGLFCGFFVVGVMGALYLEFEIKSVIETSTYKASNNKVAKFYEKELTSWDNRLVFCVSDCINYATDYTYYYQLDNVSFMAKVRLVDPKLFFERNLLDWEKIKGGFNVPEDGYDLPISLEDSISRVSSVFFKIYIEFISQNVEELKKGKVDEEKYLFFMTRKDDFNKLLKKEGFELLEVSFKK